MITKTLLSLALLALAMVAFPQQGFPADENAQDEATATAQAAPVDADAAGETGKSEKLSIIDTPLDGSSVEAFEAGLEVLRTDASVADYERLKAALEWLLVYDLSAKRSREKLYANLDGKTPTEIIDMPAYGRR